MPLLHAETISVEPEERRDEWRTGIDKWRNGVDENLASLNAGQRVLEDAVRSLERIVTGMDSLLRGDIEKDTDGIIARLHDIETTTRQIRAVLFVDSTGKKGLIHDVQDLQGRREDKRARWVNISAVLVALLTSGLIGHFWSLIETVWQHTKEPIHQTKKVKVRRSHLEENGTQPDE